MIKTDACTPFFVKHTWSQRIYLRYIKRLIDLMIVAPALVLVSPVMLVVALLIRVKLGSPVLFRQARPGYHEIPFMLYKFRTMRDAVDAQGQTLADAERITSFGSLLRKLSLDELPTLWNVLRGDMTLVGPRPLLMKYLGLYDATQRLRHAVVPGVTGWAQVNGRNALSWPEKFTLDGWYAKNASLWLDLRIVLATVWTVLGGRGVAADQHVSMPEFEGNQLAEHGLAGKADTQ